MSTASTKQLAPKTARSSGAQPANNLVSRIYRAAIRVGEDFYTIEEQVCLPLDATDDDIARAIELGTRIYTAQAESVTAQIATLRARAGSATTSTGGAPPSASDKQRQYMSDLAEQLGWTDEQLAAYTADFGFEAAALTRAQASALISALKMLTAYSAGPVPQRCTPMASTATTDDSGDAPF